MNPCNCTEDAKPSTSTSLLEKLPLNKVFGPSLSVTNQALSLESPMPHGFGILLGTCMHMEELCVSGVGKCSLALVVLSQMQAFSVYPKCPKAREHSGAARHVFLFSNASECSNLFKILFMENCFLCSILFDSFQWREEIGSAHHLGLFSFPKPFLKRV